MTLAGTRIAVWAVAVGARLAFGRNTFNASHYELGALTQPFGSSDANLIIGVLSRWDAVWYLLIATNGYEGPGGLPSPNGPDQWGASINFLPAYPSLVRLVSGLAASHRAVVIAAFAVSILAFGLALYLLYRLAEIEVGAKAATWAVALLAVFPGAVYFGVPYAESLFLALSVGAFYAARTQRWALAALLGAGAALTRFPGVLLFVPLAIFYLRRPTGREPRQPIGREAAWLLLIPAALGCYLAYTWHLTGDPLAYFHVGKSFGRSVNDPASALANAVSAVRENIDGFLGGEADRVYAGPEAIVATARVLAVLGGIALAVSAYRRLGPPYGIYAGLSLVVIVCSSGPEASPLVSVLRYIAVVFPLFIELGRIVATRSRVAWVVAALGCAGLAAAAVQYARWIYLG